MKYLTVYQVLYQAALKDNWRIAEPILKNDPSLARHKISEKGETVLHIAAAARSTLFVRKLMNLIEKEDLELLNDEGSTAFHFAAASGVVEIAKAMREKNVKLPNIPGEDGLLPITMAATIGNNDMVSYLCEVTSLDVLQQVRYALLETAIHNEMYDVALNLFKKGGGLATKVLEGNASVLYALVKKSLAISNQNQEGNWERFIIRACSPVWGMFTSAISIARMQFTPCFRRVQVLPEKSLLKKQAGLLLEELWAEFQKCAGDKLFDLVEKSKLLHSAARAGNVEFLVVLIHNHPDLIWKVDKNNRTIFHVAVLHREEKVFSLIHQIGAIKDLITLIVDNDGNNILHLVGKLGLAINKQKLGEIDAPKNKIEQSVPSDADNHVFLESLQQLLLRQTEVIKQITESMCVKEEEKIMPPSFLRVSGAALQMQREILWFKEVEKIVPLSFLRMKNNDGKTPRQLFTEEHQLLLKEGERWMKDTANSCMIAATLIATMVFAAGFTLPGGNNSDLGTPVMLTLKGFSVFVISDAVALFSSIVSIIMFLSILTSRYTEDDFLVSLPAKLLFGLTTLFVSIVSMLLAFAATFFLVYNNHMAWQPKLIAAFAGVPVALFGCLQYKLWFDVAKSTYWSKYLFRPGKHSLY
ncbi:uncharacterized protein LOC107814134 isoform X5 [Nicotiana tabacum]|nr:PREDICTED: uncharacterized protein LOC107814134 isoform X3 [Nicotiana tabacum]